MPSDAAQFVSRCFLVPKKQPNQFRMMVVDLRHVNDFAQPGSAEVETLAQLQSVARPSVLFSSWMGVSEFVGLPSLITRTTINKPSP